MLLCLTMQDYAKLQLKMVNMLEQQYLSDNFSTSDSNSRNWNNFFIQVSILNILLAVYFYTRKGPTILVFGLTVH